MPPLFPVIVIVGVPPGVEVNVLTVIVEVPPPESDAGLKETVAPVGNPEALSGTVPVNPLRAVTVTV